MFLLHGVINMMIPKDLRAEEVKIRMMVIKYVDCPVICLSC